MAMPNLTSTANALRRSILGHNEWLLDAGGKTFYLLSNEVSVITIAGKIEFGYLDDTGYRQRCLAGVRFDDGSIKLEFAENPDDGYQTAELVPRTLALDLRESVESSRLRTANSIAEKLKAQHRNFKPLRVALNDRNGRFAEILAQNGVGYVAVLADVSGALTHEALLAKAFVWLRALSARKKQRIETIWLVADRKHSGPLRALSACLGESSAREIRIWAPRVAGKSNGEPHEASYAELNARDFNSLWSGRLARLRLLKDKNPTRFASQLLRLDTENLDRIYSAKGETLRFNGLPFARTRLIGGEEKVWFGIENEKSSLTSDNEMEFEDLLENLKQYRRHDSPNKQHEYYRGAPEAWLESILRRNIKALDANLVLSPIYNQFRAAREKIDLLALRRDGRLVIIELKIAPDREMVFQAADYWRKVESQRRRGNLAAARLFGGKRIADRPTLVYLVAPTLGFHMDTEFLARKLSERINIYRFDLAENWRERISVLRRRRIGV
ncbi:MAG: hypothetical protein OEM82_05475 [Acidobacteriota bacterium]|nr:hypothetical protein [Acidobacteriota bacterium]MDH3529018.1 hypothetical protein [Acidobacteriota bacterium]